MKKLLFALLLLAIPSLGYAATPNRGPRFIEAHPDQYIQSCAPGVMQCLQLPTVGAEKQFKDNGVFVYTGRNHLYPFGEQLHLSTNGTGDVLVCLHMTGTATVTLGPANAGGDGSGYATFDGAVTRYGRLPCTVVRASHDAFIKVSTDGWAGGFPESTATSSTSQLHVTYRRGRCTSYAGYRNYGSGCATDAECGTNGYCSRVLSPLGVEMTAVGLTNNAVICAEICGQ